MAPTTASWQAGSTAISLREPLFLGVLNITPDSMSDGGRFLEPGAALAQAMDLVAQGARALDVGAESTRPGASPVAPAEEWARLEPVLTGLRAVLPEVPLSLDTRSAEVAARAVRLGIKALNDVTGFRDPELLHVARNSGCGLIAMRSRVVDGALAMPPYGGPGQDTATAAIQELAAVRDRLLEADIHPERILLDPGFGFGTTFTEDLALWEALPQLPEALRWPVERFCLGISRKRFLAWRAGTPALPPAERDPQGARAHLEAQRAGFRVFRTHAVTLPRLREALPGDARAVAEVQVASWQATYHTILPEALLANLSAETQAGAFAEAMANPSTRQRLWLVEARGRIMGFAAAGPARDPEHEGLGEIHAIYLLREAWGQGLGRALMARALAGLAEAGFTAAVLWVLERNPRGRRFYEAGGWQLSGSPRTIWQDGIALREVQYRLDLTTISGEDVMAGLRQDTTWGSLRGDGE